MTQIQSAIVILDHPGMDLQSELEEWLDNLELEHEQEFEVEKYLRGGELVFEIHQTVDGEAQAKADREFDKHDL